MIVERLSKLTPYKVRQQGFVGLPRLDFGDGQFEGLRPFPEGFSSDDDLDEDAYASEAESEPRNFYDDTDPNAKRFVDAYNLRIAVLERDQYRCFVTGSVDRHYAESGAVNLPDMTSFPECLLYSGTELVAIMPLGGNPCGWEWDNCDVGGYLTMREAYVS